MTPTDYFLAGLALGSCLMPLCMWIYKRTLKGKGDSGRYATPEKFGGEFYYIVPEKQYNRMMLLYLKNPEGKAKE